MKSIAIFTYENKVYTHSSSKSAYYDIGGLLKKCHQDASYTKIYSALWYDASHLKYQLSLYLFSIVSRLFRPRPKAAAEHHQRNNLMPYNIGFQSITEITKMMGFHSVAIKYLPLIAMQRRNASQSVKYRLAHDEYCLSLKANEHHFIGAVIHSYAISCSRSPSARLMRKRRHGMPQHLLS